MKSQEIISKLEGKGFKVEFGKYEYWEDIPYVAHEDGSKTFLAKTYTAFGSAGIEKNISFEKALKAVENKNMDINDLENDIVKKEIEEESEVLAKKFN